MPEILGNPWAHFLCIRHTGGHVVAVFPDLMASGALLVDKQNPSSDQCTQKTMRTNHSGRSFPPGGGNHCLDEANQAIVSSRNVARQAICAIASQGEYTLQPDFVFLKSTPCIPESVAVLQRPKNFPSNPNQVKSHGNPR